MIRLFYAIYIIAQCLVFSVGASKAIGNEKQPRLFDVRQYDARADGESVDTQAIQSAVDACGAAGGGRVLFPEGRYLSGTLRLRDGVELHLVAGARLIGIKELDAYTGFEADVWGRTRWNRGLVVGEGLHDVAITGAGVIDGNKVFDPRGEERMRGPHTVLLSDCRGVTLRGLTLRDSANYAFMFYASENVRVEDVTFEGGWDGVHFRGNPESWNRNVRITGCKFFTGDDCIAGHYIEDAVVEDCVINSSCNGVRLIGPMRRMAFAHCEFFGPGRFEHRTSREMHRTNMLAALVIQPSAWTPTPGPVEDLRVTDVMMRNVACALHVSLREGNTGGRLTIERIKATGIYGPAVSVESWAGQPLGEICLRDIDVQYTPDAFIDPRMGNKPKVQSPIRQPGAGVFARKLPVWGLYGRDIDVLHLDRVRLMTADRDDTRPVIRVDNVDKVILDHVQYSPVPSDVTAIERNGVGTVERNETPVQPSPPRMKTSN